MKHPVRDRIWIFLCGVCGLCVAAVPAALLLGVVTVDPVTALLARISDGVSVKEQAALAAAAIVLVLVALRLFAILLPAKKKRSSSFAYQQNENGMVRISVKALEALVQRCLNQHPELKVVSSSLFSDEETVCVDAHITLQSDISMPLAISALQKQIKRYLEACSGVVVQEVRVFVDGTIPANAETALSPYAIPASVLEKDADLSDLKDEPQEELAEAAEETASEEIMAEEAVAEAAQEAETAEEPAETCEAEEAAQDETEEPEKTDEVSE
ncbi:MAG: alkaline shock response membrane anchor protein AmaP [Clostridia bacterium]|nr:alkaline shock response membrane anchor protein AmaP [Clostridia bacterium]